MSKVYGYCRISTAKQNIERQVRNIEQAFPGAHIIRETYTGTKLQGRELFDKLLAKVKQGDTIVFDSVSRMSRNAQEGCELYEQLFEQGVKLVFLKEPHINTEVYKATIEKQLGVITATGDEATDKFVSNIMAALNEYAVDLAKQQVRITFEQSEKEVEDLRQRTREGLLTAKLNGQELGIPAGTKLTTKKSIEAKEKIRKYNKDFEGQLNNEDTWKLIGISKMTFYKYKREMIEEGSEIIKAGKQ